MHSRLKFIRNSELVTGALTFALTGSYVMTEDVQSVPRHAQMTLGYVDGRVQPMHLAKNPFFFPCQYVCLDECKNLYAWHRNSGGAPSINLQKL